MSYEEYLSNSLRIIHSGYLVTGTVTIIGTTLNVFLLIEAVPKFQFLERLP
jgi:hypothetical protein